MKERIIVVLGMHRSGTSILSAALECLGVRFGSHLLGPREDNPKGFWEDEDFVELNERLYELGGSFSSALGFDAEAVRQAPGYQRLYQRMKDLLRARLDNERLFGLKDPRMPRLMELWGEALDELGVEVSVVVPLRNPLSVAASLAKRDEFPTSKSLLLWYEHMARGLHYASRRQMLVVDYDAFMDQPREALHRIAERLGLEFDEGLFGKFSQETLSTELRHSRFSVDDLRLHIDSFPALLDLYALLKHLSQDQAGAIPDQVHRVDLEFKELWPVLRRCGVLDIELWGGAQHLKQVQAFSAAREKELSNWIDSLEATVHSGEALRRQQQASFCAREKELSSWIDSLESTVHSGEASRRQQQASFCAREKELSSWIASLEATVHSGEASRRQQQASFCAREKELSNWIDSLESTVHSGEALRRQQQASFSVRESELLTWITSLEGTLQAAEQERQISREWFQTQMLRLEALASQREQNIRQLNEKLTSTWEALQHMQSSRSWRLTRPLRWCGRMLRRS